MAACAASTEVGVMAGHAIGVDIGGTGIKGARVDLESGQLVGDRVRIETPQPATPTAVAAVVNQVIDRLGADGPVGLTLPAVVRGDIVHTASNIDRGWIGVNAVDLFGTATGRPVGAVNDADAAGLAEMRYGAGRGSTGVVIMITLGTGIGSSVFVDGSLVPNSELGHLPLHHAVAEDWAADSVRESEDLSWKQWSRRLQDYLELLERLLWPDLIIIGGGVSKKADKFLHLVDVNSAVVPAKLLNNAGIVGAALFAPRMGGDQPT
jgi:polyphosphate glucokinase